MTETKTFPVMLPPYGFKNFPIPWSVVEPHAKQAWTNHSQSLEELARRGGLSPQELWCVIHGKRWESPEQPSADDCMKWARSLQ